MDLTPHMQANVYALGTDVVYTPAAGGASKTIKGLYTGPLVETFGIEAIAPKVVCVQADIPAYAYGDSFEIYGQLYASVAPIHPDPVSGLLDITLEKR